MFEIERKYVVTGSLSEQTNTINKVIAMAKVKQCITQGYLANEKERTVRVRVKDFVDNKTGDMVEQKAYLTIKGKPEGISVKEFEYEIPVDHSSHLLALCDPRTFITKERYPIQDGDLCWEVDRMLGRHQGITLIEVELTSEDQCFVKPDWMSALPYCDVSESSTFKNACLGKMTEDEIENILNDIFNNTISM